MDKLSSRFNVDREQQRLARQLGDLVAHTGTAQEFAVRADKPEATTASPGQSSTP